jgi:2-keto-4-pentenoate hydratase
MGRLLSLALDAGETVIGWKLGMTSPTQRKQFGATDPFISPVFASSLNPPTVRQMRAPNLEVEFVGRIGKGGRLLADSRSIGIEIIDTHLQGAISYPFAIADWGLHAAASVGTACPAPIPGQGITLRITSSITTVELEGAVPERTNIESLLNGAMVDWPRQVADGDLLWTGSLSQQMPLKHPGRMFVEVDDFGTAELELLP